MRRDPWQSAEGPSTRARLWEKCWRSFASDTGRIAVHDPTLVTCRAVGPSGEPMIVLVVEDDSELRALLQQVLAPEFAVRTCACEAEARRLLESQTHGVDVLLTHLAADPGGSEELVESARACPQRIGVVVASEDPALLEAWRGRADAVVPRPYVVAAVRAALRRASWPR